MGAHTDTSLRAPAFTDWVHMRDQALQRFGYLTTGDLTAAAFVVEHALGSVHQQWHDVADVVDLEVLVRQEMLRVQTSRRYRRARAAATGAPGPPSVDGDLRQVWDACHALTVEHRAALVLRYAEQLDLMDIAEVLGRDPEFTLQLIDSAVATVDPVSAASSAAGSPAAGTRDAGSLLRATFSDYATRAPVHDDLAERVAAAARRRRHRYGAVGVAAAIGVLVPVAWLASPRSEQQAEPAPAPGVPLAAVPGMRWESYGGIEVRVPEGWGYGDLTQWCAADDAPGQVDGPAVDRPGSAGTALCTANSSTGTRDVARPTYTAGLLLRPAERGPRIGRADVADGAPVYRRRLGAVDLTVIDVERALAEQILSSATVVDGIDINGCATHANVPAMGHFLSVRSKGVQGAVEGMADTGHAAMTICHYESEPWGRPTLVFSEQFGASATVAMVAAIGAARPTDAQVPPLQVRPECAETEVALVRLSSGGVPTDVWVHYAGCGPHGIDDGVRARVLTREILRPVLDPPWRNTVGAGVPWPAGPPG